VNFLLDENLPPRLARSLNELFKGNHQVVALRDRFGQGVLDVDWINTLSQEGRWIVISADRRITKNRAEMHAFRHSRLVGFFLSKAVYKSKLTKKAARILALWDDMVTLAETVGGGATFELPIKGLIKQLK
jgi:hypothetical protein